MTNPSDREVAVFNAALQLPVEQRATYLEQACAGDDVLRSRVGGLLRVHDEVGTFLEDPTQEPGPTFAAVGPPGPAGTIRLFPSSIEKTGDRIGRYKLLQQIGEGGCGVVYMAEQTEPVRRKVALKVIKLGMDTKNVIARFEAERQALALMDHPNIAKVFDAGATETGRPFFVMELVRGVKITEYCDQNHLPTGERLKLFTQVCQAIQHAHQKGSIHRDIKPSNILVADHDGVPVPKVIDFGIAKATTDQPLTDKTLFTALEQFMGTPAYMSPEQANLSGLDIDTRTDIYSLGVLLYELLTGQTPFDARDLMAAGLEEMRRTIREQEPARPSTRLSTMMEADLKTVARDRQSDAPKLVHLVRGDLDWIVMKALEKDRARRYETASGLAMDIQRHLDCEPVVARPPSRLYEFQKTVRRHKFGFAAAAALITVLTVGALVSTWQAVRATRERQIANHERDRAVHAEAEAQQQKLNAQSEARSAAVQLADSLINQGDALTTAAEFPGAYARYAEAAEKLQQLGSPLARLDLSLVRLYRASPPPLWTTNLPGYIAGMVALPSRKEIIAACDGKFYALDQSSGAIVRSFGDSGGVRNLALAVAAEGPVLVAAGVGFVRLIDPASGAVLRQVEDDRAAKFCVISPDGSVAASGNDSGTVTIWETATFKKLGGGKQGAQVEYAAFSHDGATIATVSDNIALWDARTAQQLRRIPAPASMRVAFSADDRALVCGETGGFISTISLDGKPLARWLASRSNSGIRSLLATPEGNRVITAIDDGAVRVFDNSFGDAWTPTLTMAADQSVMFDALYVPDAGPKACAATSGVSAADQGVVIAASVRGRVFAWPLVAPDRFQGRLERAISISSDGLVCAGQVAGRVEVRDLTSGRTLRLLPQPVDCMATAFSRDGTQLYVGANDGILRAFDLLRGEYTWSVHAHNAQICSIDVAPDGALVASAAGDGTTRAWDARTGALLASLHHQGGYGTAAIFVPGADSSGPGVVAGGPSPRRQRMLIGAGDGGVVYDWDVFSDAKPKRVFARSYVRGLTLSPDQKLVAVACVAHGADLFNSATLERAGFLGPIPSAMYKLCFIDIGAGPGAWALACGGRELRAFEMATGRERLVLDSTFDDRATAATDTGTYGINTLAASGDGTVIVAKGTGRINFTLPRRYRELTQTPSPLRRAGLYAEWGLWAWVRDLLERERAAGRECPPVLLARANWMCGDYDSARRAFDLAAERHELPAWYAALCPSVADTPPTIAALPAVARPKDTLEQLPAAVPLPDGVLAAAEVWALTSQIGKEVVVEGVVTDSAWSRSGKVMNIRFASAEEGKSGLSGCLFLKDRATFDGAFSGNVASAFSGARLRLRGTLVLYGGFDNDLKGAPQMILTDPQQVTIVEQHPAHGELPVPFTASGKQSLEAEIGFNQAVRLRQEGKPAEAAAVLREALALRRKSAGGENPDTANALHKLGDLLRDSGQWTEAEEAFREAMEMRRKLFGNQHLDLAHSIHGLAWVLNHNGKRAEAETLSREELRIRTDLLGNEHPDVAETLHDLIVFLRDQGKLAEAEAVCREELAAAKKLSGSGDPSLAHSLRRLADILCDQGKWAEAEAPCREAIALLRHSVQDNPKRSDYAIDLGHSQWRLADVLAKTGRRDQVEPVLREALQVFEQAGRAFPAQLYLRQEQAYSRRLLADVLNELGRVDEAEREQRAAIALYAELKAAAPANVFHCTEESYSTLRLAMMLEGAGRLDTAETEYRHAVALHVKASSDFPNDASLTERLGTLNGRLANLLRRRGRLAEAATTAREAAQKCHAAMAQFEKLASDQDRHNECWSFAISYEAIGGLFKEIGQSQAAEKAYRDTQALWRKLVAGFNTQDNRFHLALNYDALGNVLKEAGRFDEAVEAYREALAVWKQLVAEFKKDHYRNHLSGTLLSLAGTLQTAGKGAEAELLFREAAEHADVQTLNGLAWPLATGPDPKFRDGPRAVALAEKAVAGTNRKNPMIMDTLAAAYAEAGQFTNAVRVQQEAITLLQTELEKKDYASRLKLYENNSPYRDAPVLKP